MAKAFAGGLLAVNKPIGWSSAQAVAVVKRKLQKHLGHKVKVGHGGTLDPLATGVLVLGVGQGTKALQPLLKGRKRYRARGLLGAATDTMDCTAGSRLMGRRMPTGHVELAALKAALKPFRGDIMQRPPVFSAKRIAGKRAYAMARGGEAVEAEAVAAALQPRPVHVRRLELVNMRHSSSSSNSSSTSSTRNGVQEQQQEHAPKQGLLELPHFQVLRGSA